MEPTKRTLNLNKVLRANMSYMRAKVSYLYANTSYLLANISYLRENSVREGNLCLTSKHQLDQTPCSKLVIAQS
jgi:hypothetical protein